MLKIEQFLGAGLLGYEQKYFAAQVLRLMDMLEKGHPDFKLFETHVTALREKLNRPDLTDEQFSNGLCLLQTRIISDQKIEALPVAAFLASNYPNFEQKQTDMIKAIIFITSYHLINLTDYEKVIERAMTQIRLMNNRPILSMINWLPDFTQDLKTIKSEIEKSRILCRENKIVERMGSIQVLLANFLKNEPENTRKRASSKRSPPKERNYKVERQQGSSEDDSYTYTEYFVSQQSDSIMDIDAQEREADQESVSKYFAAKMIAPAAVVKSLALQNQRAKQIANHIVKREKQLPADWSQLTDYEITTFLKEAFARYLSDSSGVYVRLLMSLLSGRSFAELISMPQYIKIKQPSGWRLKDSLVELVCNLQLPQHKIGQPLESLIQRSDSELTISIPRAIGDAFLYLPYNPLNNCALEEAAKAALAGINKKYNTRLSLNRLRSYLRYYLSCTGVDAVEINLLHGAPSLQDAGIYYYQIDSEQLAKRHHTYCIRLLRKVGKEYDRWLPQNRSRRIGSQLQLLEGNVKKLFQAIRQEADAYRLQGNQSLLEFHNVYTLFILHLLNLSSGHRPVKNPYDSIKYFDLEAGTVFISDKEVRSELSARTLALPKLAVTQVIEYLRHLQALKNYFIDINPSLYDTVQSVEEGKAPLLFFVEDDKIKFVRPALLEKRLTSVLPLPLNWHRHFMRTKLRQLGFSGQQVDAWMGHAGFGGEAFSRYSGLAMRDLKDIAERIDTFLTDQLSIDPLAAWSNPA